MPTAEDEWRSLGGAAGLALCLLLPFLAALSLRFLAAHLLPFLLRCLRWALQATTALVLAHWRAGALLARGLGKAFGAALPGPYDIGATGGAALLLAGREHARHLRYVFS
jgi:hypothetical protein